MAEGTYGSPYYQGNLASVDGNVPANKFTTNINRKKTRKWVDAKKINYDGSGWGDEDDDEEDGGADEETSDRMPPNLPIQLQHQQQPWRQASPGPGNMAVPRTSAQMRASSPGGSSAVPSPRSDSQPPSGNYSAWDSRSDSALRSRGQSPAGPVSAGQGGLGNSKGPGGLFGPRGMSPQASGGGTSGHVGPRDNFTRPSDVYSDTVTSNETSPSRAADEAAQRGRNDHTALLDSSAGNQSPLSAATDATVPATVPPSDSKIDDVITTESETQPLSQHKPQDSVDSISSAADEAANDRRYSTSPKLPNLARFSTFSPELLFGDSSAGLRTADAPPMPPIPDSPAVGAFPVEEPAASTSTPATGADGGDLTSWNASPSPKSVGEPALAVSTDDEPLGGARLSENPTVATADSHKSSAGGAHMLSESTAVKADIGPDQQTQSTPKPSESAPGPTIAPLNPYRLSGMAPFMPPPVKTPVGPRDMQRTSTMSTADTPTSMTDSPVRESDVLREEIIRTLSPARMDASKNSMDDTVASATSSKGRKELEDENGETAAAATSADEDATGAAVQDEQQIKSEPVRTLTGDSTYLQDVYDDYLTRDGAADETYTASEPPLPIPSLAGAELDSGAEASESAGVDALGATTSGTAALLSTDNIAIPKASPPEPQNAVVPLSSPSPGPDMGVVPGAFPGSNVPTPGATQPAFVQTPELRRRFSWEAGPDPEELVTVPATAAAAAPVIAHGVSSLPSQQNRMQQQQQPQAAPNAADVRTQSPPLATAEPQSSGPTSGRPDASTSVSVVSNSPVSNAAAGTGTESSAGCTEERQGQESNTALRPQAQAPVRSMLDVGEDPVQQAQSQEVQQADNRISTVESVQSDSSLALPASHHLSPTQMEPLSQPSDAQAAALGVVPSLQADQPVMEGVSRAADPTLFGSADTGNAQFLTLRQCMAFDQHHERMAKLAETRHEFAVADSGLSSWLQFMTSDPEYSRAADEPLFDNQANAAGSQGLPASTSRPVAAVAATISRVPHHVHVAVPSSTQISNKSKEIFSVATGKAGKGLQALRKKGFHKKSSN
ncbi:hypothetical protein SEPCBS57363_000689 [Sporothrix epigloea]|uniref:Uncharacterized protein n=1 Tax=Sporothrix epigloea TaxID=1892477 RepID=A0ABP0D979_9PEZI